MKVYVVLEGSKKNMYNDWTALEYYNEINCKGVFTTLKLAAASIEADLNKLVKTVLSVDEYQENNIIAPGKCWLYNNDARNFFIIKRKLIVE